MKKLITIITLIFTTILNISCEKVEIPTMPQPIVFVDTVIQNPISTIHKLTIRQDTTYTVGEYHAYIDTTTGEPILEWRVLITARCGIYNHGGCPPFLYNGIWVRYHHHYTTPDCKWWCETHQRWEEL